MKNFIQVFDVGGGVRDVEFTEGGNRVSGNTDLTALSQHLAEHAAILGTPPTYSRDEYVLVKDAGGGIRQVPVVSGVKFISSDSNTTTYNGHVAEHTAMDDDVAVVPGDRDFVKVYDRGGGIRNVPVINSARLIEGNVNPLTCMDHNAIHAVTSIPPGLEMPSVGRTLLAGLVSSLILDEGAGNPTWSRATAAWRFNELGLLQSVPSGCAVFGGARLIRNLVPTPSNVLAVSGTKTVTLSAAATLQFSMGAGSGIATFSGTGGATGTLTAGSTRVSINKSVAAGTFIVTASVADLVDLQITDVTGYASTYVPEYVSVGVVSTPFFGAGIDGAKYFTTDQYGAPLPAASLLGFRRENVATNNLLWNRDLSNAAWTKTNVTAAKNAIGLDGIANTATTLTATATNATILQAITLASAARCASAYVRRKTGTGTISFTQDNGSTWTDITSQLNTSTFTRVEITATLANPSVGFKISTSGDAIEVDCVQNVAGSIATSPIVTTTAAVTRNADSLSYQTASNIDFTIGTLYGEIMSNTGSFIRHLALINDAYAGISASQTTSWRAADSTNISTVTGLTNITTGLRKRVVCWGSGALKSSGDGITPVSGAFDGNFGSGAAISIGDNINGYIRNIAVYNYAMTDAEMMSITT